MGGGGRSRHMAYADRPGHRRRQGSSDRPFLHARPGKQQTNLDRYRRRNSLASNPSGRHTLGLLDAQAGLSDSESNRWNAFITSGKKGKKVDRKKKGQPKFCGKNDAMMFRAS